MISPISCSAHSTVPYAAWLTTPSSSSSKAFVFVQENGLFITTLQQTNKLNVQKTPLPECPRRIVSNRSRDGVYSAHLYHKETRNVILATFTGVKSALHIMEPTEAKSLFTQQLADNDTVCALERTYPDDSHGVDDTCRVGFTGCKLYSRGNKSRKFDSLPVCVCSHECNVSSTLHC